MILITGAAGFVGRHVVAQWLEARPGEPPRVLLSRPRPGFAERFAGVETVCGDLLDHAVLERSVAGISTVIHLASKNVDRDGSGFERVNVEGTRKLCRAAAVAGVERVIYLSSVGVYGHGAHRDADETTPVRPDTPFSRSKAEAERIVLGYHREGGPRGVVLRHRFVYGEGDEAVMPRLMKVARGVPLWISGGRARMSLVWARDLARVVGRLTGGAADGAADPVFHVTDGRAHTYRRVVTALCDAFGYRPPRVSVPFALLYAPVRLREHLLGIDPEVSASPVTSMRLKLVAQDNGFSSRKLQDLLPDLPFATFEEGLRGSLDYYSKFR